ncbi:uncharacterized protein LOC144084778 [Stigmatopora argus]
MTSLVKSRCTHTLEVTGEKTGPDQGSTSSSLFLHSQERRLGQIKIKLVFKKNTSLSGESPVAIYIFCKFSLFRINMQLFLRAQNSHQIKARVLQNSGVSPSKIAHLKVEKRLATPNTANSKVH